MAEYIVIEFDHNGWLKVLKKNKPGEFPYVVEERIYNPYKHMDTWFSGNLGRGTLIEMPEEPFNSVVGNFDKVKCDLKENDIYSRWSRLMDAAYEVCGYLEDFERRIPKDPNKIPERYETLWKTMSEMSGEIVAAADMFTLIYGPKFLHRESFHLEELKNVNSAKLADYRNYFLEYDSYMNDRKARQDNEVSITVLNSSRGKRGINRNIDVLIKYINSGMPDCVPATLDLYEDFDDFDYDKVLPGAEFAGKWINDDDNERRFMYSHISASDFSERRENLRKMKDVIYDYAIENGVDKITGNCGYAASKTCELYCALAEGAGELVSEVDALSDPDKEEKKELFTLKLQTSVFRNESLQKSALTEDSRYASKSYSLEGVNKTFGKIFNKLQKYNIVQEEKLSAIEYEGQKTLREFCSASEETAQKY